MGNFRSISITLLTQLSDFVELQQCQLVFWAADVFFDADEIIETDRFDNEVIDGEHFGLRQ